VLKSGLGHRQPRETGFGGISVRRGPVFFIAGMRILPSNFTEEAKINDTDGSSEEDSIVEQSDIHGKGGEKESLALQVDQTSDDKRGIGQNRGLERAGR